MEIVIQVSTQFHNGPFHVIAPYIAAFFSQKAVKTADFQFNEADLSRYNRAAFQKTKGYKAFLEAFAEYYKLPNNSKLPDRIISLLEKYPHPLDCQVLLGPVLRIALKKILLSEKEHKTELKGSFKRILSQCAQRYRQAHGKETHSEPFKIAWLTQMPWEDEEECEVLFRSNIELIAQMIGSGKISLSEHNWDEAYKRYCDYQGCPNRSIEVSVDLLTLLCNSFNFGLELKKSQVGRQTPTGGSAKFLTNIFVDKKTGDQWVLIARKGSQWDYHKGSETTRPTLTRYHDISGEFVSADVNHRQIALLQNTFRDKIHTVLTTNAAYKEDLYEVLTRENWANNSGMEGLIEIIIDNINETDFQKQPGFIRFLRIFRQYYGLEEDCSTEETLEAFDKLINAYPIPEERFMLFSPLLRLMLGEINGISQNLSPQALLRLSYLFNVRLELYNYRGAQKVSVFDRIFVPDSLRGPTECLALTATPNGWQQVEKDSLKARMTSAITPYSKNHAFLQAGLQTKPLLGRLRALQMGITDFLHTDIMYVEGHTRRPKIPIGNALLNGVDEIHRLVINGSPAALKSGVKKKKLNVNQATANKPLALRYFIDCTAVNWTPLHFAVFFGNAQKVAQLLTLGANWRLKAKWEVEEKDLMVSQKAFSQNVSALELAACLDLRQIVSLILGYAIPGSDDKLVAEAYQGACNFKRTKVLYSFLSDSKVKHLPQAIMNAIEDKDLSLVSVLSKKGVALPPEASHETAILRLSLQKRAPHDLKYSLALQNLLLLSLHQTRVRKSQLDTGSFKFNKDALNVVERALTLNVPEWIANLVEYLELMPILLHKEKVLSPVMMRNFEQILEIIAKQACSAVAQRNALKLTACLTADQRCLIYPGKDNPLHAALQHSHYYFARNTYADFIVSSLQSLRGKAFDKALKEKIRQSALTEFSGFGDKAYDRYERTLSFRLERVERKEHLYSALEKASFFQGVKVRVSIVAFNMKEAQIYCADKIFERAKNTAKVTQNPIYRFGYPALTAIRSIGMLATSGPIRYGFHLGWHLLPSMIKAPLVYTVGKLSSYAAPYVNVSPEAAQFFVPLALENALTLALMPQYYVASTLLGTGVYWAFKDSGYDNLEALAQLTADGIAYSWATGSDQNHVIDDRYGYNLTRNLTPFVGEAWANKLVPVVSWIDGASMEMNKAVNLPIDTLGSYFSANSLAKMQSFLGASSLTFESLPFSKPLSTVFDMAKKGYDSFQYIQFQKHLLGERAFNFIENATLGLMADSAFKRERLHAMQSFETSALSYTITELQKILEDSKKQEAAAKDQYEKLQKDAEQAAVAKAYKEYQAKMEAVVSVQKMLDAQHVSLEASKTHEEVLFKQTEGFQYFEAWQEKHATLKYAEVDKFVSADQLKQLKEEERAALEKSKFYNSDATNKAAEHWGEALDELFQKHHDNFKDWTNPAGFIQEITNSTFDVSTDRNVMAKYAADQIIRIKYPFYPDIGDAQGIEAERQKYIDEISTDELSGYKRHPEKSKDRLYKYILAKLTNTEKPKHIHRYEKIFWPFINEILGKTIGWVPFKDFKGGRTNAGSIGIQYNRTIGAGQSVDMTVAGHSIHRVYDSNKKSQTLFSIQQPLKQSASSALPLVESFSSLSELSPSAIRGMDIDNPYIVAIMNEMYDQVFGQAKEKTATKVQPMREAKTKSKSEAQHSEDTHQVSHQNPAQKMNQDPPHNPHPKLAAFLQGVSESVIPAPELPRLAFETVKESCEDLIEGAIWIAKFAGREAKRGVRGEELETKKALYLLGTLFGEEAARVALNEQTKTAQMVREIASNFSQMSKEDRTKAIGKIALMFAMPAFGVGLVKRYNFRSTTLVKSQKPVLPLFDTQVTKGYPVPTLPVKANYLGEFGKYKSAITIKPDAVQTFFGWTYKSYVLQEDVVLWRVGKKNFPIGEFYIFDKPSSELLSRIDSAVKPVWPNGKTSIIDTAFAVKVPKGTTIHVGLTKPQGGMFLGGTTQIYIEDAVLMKNLKVMESFPIKEELLWNQQARKLSR